MSEQTVDFQAKIYVYALLNCACEFGFNADKARAAGSLASQKKSRRK